MENNNLKNEQQCAIHDVSVSLRIAETSDIFKRITELYKNADYTGKAHIAKICDEVLDRSGVFLGEVRKYAAMNANTKIENRFNVFNRLLKAVLMAKYSRNKNS